MPPGDVCRGGTPGFCGCVAGQPAARSGGAQDDGLRARVLALAEEWEVTAHDEEATRAVAMWEMADHLRRALAGPDRRPVPLPLHRTEAGYPRCATCDGGGCPDCTDPA